MSGAKTVASNAVADRDGGADAAPARLRAFAIAVALCGALLAAYAALV